MKKTVSSMKIKKNKKSFLCCSFTIRTVKSGCKKVRKVRAIRSKK
jgi:hypothetical protein